MNERIPGSAPKKTSGVRVVLLRLCLAAGSILLLMTCLELVLRPHWIDNERVEQPIWIHPDFEDASRKIEHTLMEYASTNPYGFTDRLHTFAKPAGTRRIAFLGDSFLWGSGLDTASIWSHRVAAMIARKYPRVESLHWGQRGWSTLDEFAFLKDTGVRYDIDLLVVGFVSNDPDVYRTAMRLPTWQDAAILAPMRFLFPYAHGWLAAHGNNILERTILPEQGYRNWERGLYEPDNLQEYGRLLKSLAAFCAAHHIDLVFVMTPTGASPVFDDYFRRITPLFDAAGISYRNLCPSVQARFASHNARSLWAHPADSHPGPLLTELFAEETLAWLERTGRLEDDSVAHP